KGARVAVLFPNGPDFVVAWLAASRIGAVVVPLNTFYKPRELGYVLRHADVHTLLTAPRLLANDYLERLGLAAPSPARPRARAPPRGAALRSRAAAAPRGVRLRRHRRPRVGMAGLRAARRRGRLARRRRLPRRARGGGRAVGPGGARLQQRQHRRSEGRAA